MKRDSMLTEVDLMESFDSPLREAVVEERDDRYVVRNVVVLGESTKYPVATQIASTKLFDGARAYLNSKKNESRRIQDLIGKVTDVRVEKNKSYGHLALIPNRLVKQVVLPAIRYDPSVASLALNARGRINAHGICEEITGVRGVDLVCEGDTAGGLLESINHKSRDNAAVLQLIEQSRIIPAENKLGIYKRCAGMSLNDAKIFVEAIEQSLRIVARQKPTRPINNPEKFLNTLLDNEEVSQNYSRWANLLRR